ncbi:vomeronasal type-1 receptor 4-like [Trichosurus vulpecula]|uniref:vomeronasal type-1 receptor 4-like n=1 Tax=Trichosurus vulpecula TaxID=9337 RepID=UPI00186B1BA9|nr:vomeronasal type-1 receptor 4-like [Trichosurus vulpecula]
MSAFGLSNFMNDLICKFIIYLHRVARGLSLSTTCLLSSVQAITISSGRSTKGQLKTQVPKYIFPSILLSWIFHLLSNYALLGYISIPKISKNFTEIIDLVICSSVFVTSVSVVLYLFIISLFDAVCVAIMLWTGGYMIFFLYRHHQQIRYIHRSKLTSGDTPKIRATRTIVLLVSFFFGFYSLNSIFAWQMFHKNRLRWLPNYSAFLAACFPALSPFVVIINDSQISTYFFTLWRMIKPQS